MAEITPLARGPLTPREQAVLDTLALAQWTRASLAAAAGVSEPQLEDALAQLTRRGLISRSTPKERRGAFPLRGSRRPGAGNQTNPTTPAA